MLTKCATCKARILAGGEMFRHWRFCSDGCADRFRAILVDEFIPKETVDQHIRQAFEAPCALCGKRAGNDVYSATKVSAFLLFFNVNTERHACCASCGRWNRLKAALHCFFAGWWGPKAAFCNLFVLPTNLIAAACIRRPREASGALIALVKSSMAESLSPQLLAPVQKASAGTDQPVRDTVQPRPDEMFAQIRAAEENGWWRGMTGLVGPTDEHLVVIGPRRDATPDDLRELGQALQRWKAEFPGARHIWGLDDLLDGKTPRTPPIYVMVPFPLDEFAESFEPVALVFVAEGTDIENAAKDLYERLRGIREKLAWFEHPETYSYWNR